MPIEDFLLVHVHYIELVGASGELAFFIGFSRDFEEKPTAVSFSVCVRLEIKIELFRLHLKG